MDLGTLSLFAAAVLLLMMSPGPNMAFVVAHGAAYGWRGGMAAAAGIGIADVVLTLLTATGVTAAVAQWPPAFDLLRFAGAVYLLWMAFKAIRHPGMLKTQSATHTSWSSICVRATLNSLLNPKALLFFLVFLPQFVDHRRGEIAGQLLVLGGLLTLIAIFFHAALGALGSSVARLAPSSPNSVRWRSRVLASVLVLLAVRLALTASPS